MRMRDLTNEEREAILREILLKSNETCLSRLPKGFGHELTTRYNCDVSTIRRVFCRAKNQGLLQGNMKVSVASRKKGRVGRKKAFSAEQVKAKLIQLSLSDRTTLRTISEKTGIVFSIEKVTSNTPNRDKPRLFASILKLGMFRAHSSATRPLLTDANKYGRLKFALSMVTSTMELNDMSNYVHLDEKWFYMTRETRKYYIVPGEKEPVRKCKSIHPRHGRSRLRIRRPKRDKKIGRWKSVQEVG